MSEIIEKTYKLLDALDNSGVIKKLEFGASVIADGLNVFNGSVKDGKVYIGEDAVLEVTNVPDQEVMIGIRPEGFNLDADGPLKCKLSNVEVMGRDVSIVSTHEASANPDIRSIINADNKVDITAKTVRYSLKPHKVFLFNKETEERIRCEVK